MARLESRFRSIALSASVACLTGCLMVITCALQKPDVFRSDSMQMRGKTIRSELCAYLGIHEIGGASV
jgi:hypothetical protein